MSIVLSWILISNCRLLPTVWIAGAALIVPEESGADIPQGEYYI